MFKLTAQSQLLICIFIKNKFIINTSIDIYVYINKFFSLKSI